MTNMIAMTREQKRELLAAVCNTKFKLDVFYTHDMRRYYICDKKGHIIYSIEAYNNQRRIVKHYDNIIADSETFGDNVAELNSINYILSVFINNYNREITKYTYTGKHK